MGQSASAVTDEVTVGNTRPAQRVERKFFITPRSFGLAYFMLRQVCRRDDEYPEGQINSLYFDTPDLDQHTRSSSGEFRKDKVRIRWYDRSEEYHGLVPVYLEVKTRQGFASTKQRRRFLVPTQNLDTARLGTGIIDRFSLIDTLASLGQYPKQPLQPVIVISYWRYRFTEMLTGVRVSMDSRIGSTMVTPGLGSGERDLQVRGSIIEVKGPNMELPPTLRRMRLLDTDWSRFSKYSHCLDAHLTERGTVGRLWPSGRFPQS